MNKNLKKEGRRISLLNFSLLFLSLFLAFIFNVNTHAAGDTKKPYLEIIDDTEKGPISSDTITINVVEENPDFSSYLYTFSDLVNVTCSDLTDYTLAYNSGEAIHITDSSHNGKYLCFQAMDLSGNINYIQTSNPLNISVIDTTAPNITLIGGNNLKIEAGGTYIDPGATCIDDVDGTLPITQTGTIDTNTNGSQQINFSCTDLSGNMTTESRSVVIFTNTTAPDAPTIISPLDGATVSSNSFTISGLGDAGDIILINNNGDSFSGIVDGAGNWSMNINTTIEGNNTFSITEIDPTLSVSLPTLLELIILTSPDSDGDGVPDTIEISQGTDINNINDFLDTDGDSEPDFADFDDDNDGGEDWIEDLAPNNGDANADGINDSQQDTVSSIVNSVTQEYVTLEVTTTSTGSCSNNGYQVYDEADLATQDTTTDFPVGLNDFSIDCTQQGMTTSIKVYYSQEYDTSSWTYKKYNSTTGEYRDISSAVSYSSQNIGGNIITVAEYNITDGGALDEDGIANGTIVDPAGPAIDEIDSFPVCGEGKEEWGEIQKKFKQKRIEKIISQKFGKNKTSKKQEISDTTLEKILEKYNACELQQGEENYIPKKISQKTKQLIKKINSIKNKKQKNFVTSKYFLKLEKYKNKISNEKTINTINYIQAELAINFYN